MALIRDCRDVAAWGGPEIGVNATLANNRQQSTAFGTITPPNGCSVMQKISIFQGDGHFGSSTSFRCLSYLAPNAPSYTSGYDSWLAIGVLLPTGYPNAATSVFVAPWEMHHSTQPTGVAPAHVAFQANGMDVNSYGGSFAAGGIGNPGRQTNISTTFTGTRFTTRLRWHVMVIHYKHGFNNDGAFGLDYGLTGTDAAVGSLVNLTGINTMFGNRTNYVEHGLYCGNDTTFTMYQAGTMEFSTRPEAVNWANTMLGGTVAPPPPPDPTLDAEPANWIGGRYAVTGTTALGSQIDKQRVSRTVVDSTATATGMGLYFEPVLGTSAVETVKLAVWPDNGSGTDPGTGPPLAVTSEISISAASPLGRYSANFVSPVSLAAGQVVWRGMINGGAPNEAYMRYQPVTGVFRLMTAPYANGPVAWDTVNDAAFDIDMVLWITGTPTSGAPPQNLSAPIISGTPVVGNALLLVSTGQWSSPQPFLAYEWQRDGQGNGSFSTIQTGTSTYTLVTADVGCKVRALVTGTNTLGATAAGSNQLGPVTGASVPAGATGRAALAGHSVTATRSVTSTRRAYEGGGG